MAIPRIIRAIGTAISIFLSNEPKSTFVLLAGGAVVVGLVLYSGLNQPPIPQETPEQLRDRVAAAERQTAERRAAEAKAEMLCKLRPICTKFAQVRQECAAAGNFKNCIRVKMGANDYDQTENCTEDGEIAIAPASEIPDRVSCFLGN